MPVCGFMYQPVEGSADAVTDAMQWPNIRMFTVPKVSSEVPKYDCGGAVRGKAPKRLPALFYEGWKGYRQGKAANDKSNSSALPEQEPPHARLKNRPWGMLVTFVKCANLAPPSSPWC